MKFPYDDTISGIDKHEASELCGKLVVEDINLWDSPRQDKVVGSLKHGASVQVLQHELSPDGRTFYRIRFRKLAGWVWVPFLADTWLCFQGASDDLPAPSELQEPIDAGG